MKYCSIMTKTCANPIGKAFLLIKRPKGSNVEGYRAGTMVSADFGVRFLNFSHLFGSMCFTIFLELSINCWTSTGLRLAEQTDQSAHPDDSHLAPCRQGMYITNRHFIS